MKIFFSIIAPLFVLVIVLFGMCNMPSPENIYNDQITEANTFLDKDWTVLSVTESWGSRDLILESGNTRRAIRACNESQKTLFPNERVKFRLEKGWDNGSPRAQAQCFLFATVIK